MLGNKEVCVKHEKAPTASRLEVVLTISFMPMFWKSKLLGIFGHRKLAETVKRHIYIQDLLYERILGSLRPSVTKKQPEKAHV